MSISRPTSVGGLRALPSVSKEPEKEPTDEHSTASSHHLNTSQHLQRVIDSLTDYKGMGWQMGLTAVGDATAYTVKLIARTAGVSSTLGLAAMQLFADEAASGLLTARQRTEDGDFLHRFGYEILEGITAQLFMRGIVAAFGGLFAMGGIVGLTATALSLTAASVFAEQAAALAGSARPTFAFNSPDGILPRILDTFLATARGKAFSKLKRDKPMGNIRERSEQLGYDWKQWRPETEGTRYPAIVRVVPAILHDPASVSPDKSLSQRTDLDVHQIRDNIVASVKEHFGLSTEALLETGQSLEESLRAVARRDPELFSTIKGKDWGSLTSRYLTGRKIVTGEEYALSCLQTGLLEFGRWGRGFNFAKSSQLENVAVYSGRHLHKRRVTPQGLIKRYRKLPGVDPTGEFAIRVGVGGKKSCEGENCLEYRLTHKGTYVGRDGKTYQGVKVVARVAVVRRVGGYAIVQNQGHPHLKDITVVKSDGSKQSLLNYTAHHAELGKEESLHAWFQKQVVHDLRREDPTGRIWWLRTEYRHDLLYGEGDKKFQEHQEDVLTRLRPYEIRRRFRLETAKQTIAAWFGSMTGDKEAATLRRNYQTLFKLNRMAREQGFVPEGLGSPWYVLYPDRAKTA